MADAPSGCGANLLASLLPCGRPAPLPAGGLLLGSRAALGGVTAQAGLFPTAARGTGRIGDLCCALLRHALVLERLVLLLVLYVCTLLRHGCSSLMVHLELPHESDAKTAFAAAPAGQK